MVEKAAKARQRSQRKDPTQEAIVHSKDEINERTSRLIRLLIELKRGWNGNPAPEVGVPQKYNLTDPMPDQLPSTGDAALKELTSIIQGLHQIDDMQDNYSSTRTQRISERMKQMQELQQQAAIEAGLRKEASNRLTRAWAYIVAPFGSEQGKWERLKLLHSLARVNSNLKDVEEAILSGDPGILDSLYIAKQLYLDAKGSFFEAFRKNLTGMLYSTRAELSQLNDEIKAEKEKQKELEQQKSTEEQGPLTSGPGPALPKGRGKKGPSASDLEKQVDKIVSKLDERIKERTEKQEKQRDLKPESKVMPQRPKEETPTEPEPVPETPPPEEPVQPDPREKQWALRQFILGKRDEMYNNVARNLGDEKYREAPEYWAQRLSNQWEGINNAAQQIPTSKGDRQWVLNYLTFIKAIGDLQASVYTFDNELRAAQLKPDFQFGTTVDEGQLENQARNFVNIYREDLAKFASSDDEQLIAQGGRLSRWVKRMLTELSWKRDKHLRLQAANQAKSARSGLQAMLDNLEKRNINFRQLINQSDAFYDSFIQLYDKLADLADSYNSRMRIEKSERKVKKERMRYDLIPTTDINAMRIIRNRLVSDRQDVRDLDALETDVSKLQASLDKIRQTGAAPEKGEDESVSG
jgi:hypothetical protein